MGDSRIGARRTHCTRVLSVRCVPLSLHTTFLHSAQPRGGELIQSVSGDPLLLRFIFCHSIFFRPGGG